MTRSEYLLTKWSFFNDTKDYYPNVEDLDPYLITSGFCKILNKKNLYPKKEYPYEIIYYKNVSDQKSHNKQSKTDWLHDPSFDPLTDWKERGIPIPVVKKKKSF